MGGEGADLVCCIAQGHTTVWRTPGLSHARTSPPSSLTQKTHLPPAQDFQRDRQWRFIMFSARKPF